MAITALTWFDLLLLALATWSLSSMITREKGPFDIFERFRTRLPLGGLTTCIYCMARWIAILLLAIHIFTPVFTWALAVSGAALMLKSFTGVGHDL